MIKHKIYEMSAEDLESNLTEAMAVTLQVLVNKDLIDEEEAQEFIDTHTIKLFERGRLLKRLADKFFGSLSENVKIGLVKIENFPDEGDKS